MSKLSSFFKNNRFNVISWTVTFILVAGMILGALRWKQSNICSHKRWCPFQLPAPDDESLQGLHAGFGGDRKRFESIEREIQIKTNIPADKPRYEPEDYRVARGDFDLCHRRSRLSSNQKPFCGQTMMFCRTTPTVSSPDRS